MVELPKLPGTYALILRLESPQRIRPGRLGEFDLPAGHYVYVGSAFGPGGLRARLERHLTGSSALHWHIDHLRRLAIPAWIAYACATQRLECAWSRGLNAMPGARVPVPGFGASDCRSGCPAHLVVFPGQRLRHDSILKALQNVSGGARVHLVML